MRSFALAVGVATALASGALATTPQKCGNTFLSSLVATNPATAPSVAFGQPNSPYGNCVGNLTANLTTAYFPSNPGFTTILSQALTSSQALVALSPVLNASAEALWWNVANNLVAGAWAQLPSGTQTALGGTAPTPCPASTLSSAASASSTNPCPTKWNAAVWAGVQTNLTNLYTAVQDTLAYNTLLGFFQYIPPCFPTACGPVIVGVCNNAATTPTSDPVLLVSMAEVFVNLGADIQVMNNFFATWSSGPTLAAGINAYLASIHQSPLVLTPPAFNCSSFGGWGSKLSSTYGGTLGDASATARVGFIAAAVAIVAATVTL